ncbi:MAG: hypothetical protein ACLSTT_06425 [Evtepia gabavorous]
MGITGGMGREPVPPWEVVRQVPQEELLDALMALIESFEPHRRWDGAVWGSSLRCWNGQERCLPGGALFL